MISNEKNHTNNLPRIAGCFLLMVTHDGVWVLEDTFFTNFQKYSAEFMTMFDKTSQNLHSKIIRLH